MTIAAHRMQRGPSCDAMALSRGRMNEITTSGGVATNFCLCLLHSVQCACECEIPCLIIT